MDDVQPSAFVAEYTKGWCFVVGALAAAEDLPLAPRLDPRMVRLIRQRRDHQEFARLTTERQRGYAAAKAIWTEIARDEKPVRYDLAIRPERSSFSLAKARQTIRKSSGPGRSERFPDA